MKTSQWHGREMTLQTSSVIFQSLNTTVLQTKKTENQTKPNLQTLKLPQTLKFHSLSAMHQKIVTFCCGKQENLKISVFILCCPILLRVSKRTCLHSWCPAIKQLLELFQNTYFNTSRSSLGAANICWEKAHSATSMESIEKYLHISSSRFSKASALFNSTIHSMDIYFPRDYFYLK